MFIMSFKRSGAKIALYFLFEIVFGILKLNQIDYEMYLENLFGIENLTKFSLEVLKIFGAFGFFS